MKIQKVHIKNFRNLKDICVYPAKTTVIVGENNAGKSNFLHALRLIFDPMAERLRLDISEADINDEARKLGEFFFIITVEIGDLQKHIDIEAVFRDRINKVKGTKETFITIEGKYEKDSEGIYTRSEEVV
jgi:putative ATP-dependent endonuclease of OLD family